MRFYRHPRPRPRPARDPRSPIRARPRPHAVYPAPLVTRQERRHSCRDSRGRPEMAVPTDDLIQGTLDLLILKALSLQKMHGWGVALRIQQISGDALQVNQGSLYPALHKLERRGWIQAEWGVSDNNRRAQYYSLTAIG